ncbi:glycosyltransferase [Inquilinus sp. KBS0705]|nr:glycosyltransferase [Inquilinus sp. KBS0705]
MKVLWFSLSPGLGDVHLNDNNKGIGWIKALQKNIQDSVQLSIVFYLDTNVEPFTLGTTRYFPVNRYRSGKILKAKERMLNAIEPEADQQVFLTIIEQVKPDIIHIHGTESPFGLIQKYTQIPTVVSIQGIITVYRYKYYSKISYWDVLRNSAFKSFLYQRGFNNIYKRFAGMAQREKEIFKLSGHIIGRTDWDRRVTTVLSPNAIYYHNDEVLRESFYKHAWNNTLSGCLTLFTTTGADLYKGIETVLYCAALLDKIGVNYQWQIAGLSKSDELVHIASRCIKTPISPNIKFLGGLNEKALAQSLLNAHIYIACSHIENSPNSLCEAQILGLPCIATNAGGTNTLLKDKKDGLLIQDGDPYSLAGTIIELRDNYAQAIAYGKSSRQKALLRHNPAKITAELLEIYKKVIQSN